jgi:hypothetical protein
MALNILRSLFPRQQVHTYDYVAISTVDDMPQLETTEHKLPYMAIPVPEDEMETIIKKWCVDNKKTYVPIDSYTSMAKIYTMLQTGKVPLNLSNDIECLYMGAITKDKKYYMKGIEMDGIWCFGNYMNRGDCNDPTLDHAANLKIIERYVRLYPDNHEIASRMAEYLLQGEYCNRSYIKAYDLLQKGVAAKHDYCCYLNYIICCDIFWEYYRAFNDCVDALLHNGVGAYIFVYIDIMPTVYIANSGNQMSLLGKLHNFYCQMKNCYDIHHNLELEYVRIGILAATDVSNMDEEDKAMNFKIPKQMNQLSMCKYNLS